VTKIPYETALGTAARRMPSPVDPRTATGPGPPSPRVKDRPRPVRSPAASDDNASPAART